MLPKTTRYRRLRPERRKALAWINHPASAVTSERREMIASVTAGPVSTSASAGETPTSTGASKAATTSEPASATAVMIARLRLCNQGRAGKEREPIESSFHNFESLELTLYLLNHSN